MCVRSSPETHSLHLPSCNGLGRHRKVTQKDRQNRSLHPCCPFGVEMECDTNAGKLPTENQRWSWSGRNDETVGDLLRKKAKPLKTVTLWWEHIYLYIQPGVEG